MSSATPPTWGPPRWRRDSARRPFTSTSAGLGSARRPGSICPARGPALSARRRGEGGLRQGVSAAPRRGVVARAVAAAVVRMMIRTVEDGTGKLAAVPGYVVAGKTGTAQIPAPGGGYLQGRYHFS